MVQAFKPLGVYLDFWQPSLPSATKRTYRVQLVNDTHETATGRLSLTWEPQQGGLPVQAETRFTVAPVGTAVCGWNWPRLPGRVITCWSPGPSGTASRGRPRSPGERCRSRPPARGVRLENRPLCPAWVTSRVTETGYEDG